MTRRSIAVRWIQRNASGSVIRWCAISSPLARSMTLRVSSRCVASAICARSAVVSAYRATATSTAGSSETGQRLAQVPQGAGVTGPGDQVPMGDRRDHHDGRDLLVGDLARSLDAVLLPQPTSMMTRSGRSACRHGHHLLAVAGLADHVETLLDEHFSQRRPCAGFVIGDHDPPGAGESGFGIG